jgi:iron complex outermembrane receptor protein
VPAFNTPKNKFNLGFSGKGMQVSLYPEKKIGFWVKLQMDRGLRIYRLTAVYGFIRSYDMLDAQVNYVFPKQLPDSKNRRFKSYLAFQPLFRNDGETDKFKAMFDNRNSQVYGGPNVGRLVYLSLLFEIPAR